MLIQRMVLYVVACHSLRWLLSFAEDFYTLFLTPGVFRNILVMIVFMRALGVPIKRVRCRGGFGVSRVGYYLCLEQDRSE